MRRLANICATLTLLAYSTLASGEQISTEKRPSRDTIHEKSGGQSGVSGEQGVQQKRIPSTWLPIELIGVIESKDSRESKALVVDPSGDLGGKIEPSPRMVKRLQDGGGHIDHP